MRKHEQFKKILRKKLRVAFALPAHLRAPARLSWDEKLREVNEYRKLKEVNRSAKPSSPFARGKVPIRSASVELKPPLKVLNFLKVGRCPSSWNAFLTRKQVRARNSTGVQCEGSVIS